MENSKKKTLKKTLGIIGNTVLWLFVVFAVLITVLVFSSQQNDTGLPTLMGKRMVNILTESMKPTINPGDMIVIDVVSEEEAAALEKGTVITYYTDLNGDGSDEINTHTIYDVIVENGETYYITKGDNNPGVDKDKNNNDVRTKSNKIIGVYNGGRVPGLGNFLSFLQSSTGFLVCIVLPLVLFFLFELYNFISIIVKSKKKISKEDEERIKQEAIAEYLKQQSAAKSAESTVENPEAQKPEDNSDTPGNE